MFTPEDDLVGSKHAILYIAKNFCRIKVVQSVVPIETTADTRHKRGLRTCESTSNNENAFNTKRITTGISTLIWRQSSLMLSLSFTDKVHKV